MKASPAALLAAAAVLSACDGNRPSRDATIDTLPGGIVRVTNHGPAEWSDTTGWKLALERTIQPAEGAPGELGQPSSIALHPEGHVLVRDNSPDELKLFAAAGGPPILISRVGDGPGEFRDPLPGFLGDTIVVQDQRRALVMLHDLAGGFLRDFPSLCCHGTWELPIDDAGRIYVRGSGRNPDEPFWPMWVRFTTAGERVDSIALPPAHPEATWVVTNTSGGGMSRAWAGIPFTGSAPPLVLRSGEVAFGIGRDPWIMVGHSGRDTVRIFGRDDRAPVPLPDGVADSAFAAIVERNASFAAVARREDIPDHHPYWRSIHQDGDGNAWILADEGSESPGWFDVYSEAGILRGSVPAPTVNGRFPLWAWAGDRVAIRDIDEADLPRIRVFRIDRSRP